MQGKIATTSGLLISVEGKTKLNKTPGFLSGEGLNTRDQSMA